MIQTIFVWMFATFLNNVFKAIIYALKFLAMKILIDAMREIINVLLIAILKTASTYVLNKLIILQVYNMIVEINIHVNKNAKIVAVQELANLILPLTMVIILVEKSAVSISAYYAIENAFSLIIYIKVR